jgi:amino acid transporter
MVFITEFLFAGSGIFVTPAGILSEVNSVYTALLIWLICGLVSILGAFCFVELAQLVPKSGAGINAI